MEVLLPFKTCANFYISQECSYLHLLYIFVHLWTEFFGSQDIEKRTDMVENQDWKALDEAVIELTAQVLCTNLEKLPSI